MQCVYSRDPYAMALYEAITVMLIFRLIYLNQGVGEGM